jgi:hypothetical protein
MKDTITMLLLAGWNRHDSISAPIWSLTTRKHFWLPTSHRHSVASKEQLTIRSFDTDQSQPAHSTGGLRVLWTSVVMADSLYNYAGFYTCLHWRHFWRLLCHHLQVIGICGVTTYSFKKRHCDHLVIVNDCLYIYLMTLSCCWYKLYIAEWQMSTFANLLKFRPPKLYHSCMPSWWNKRLRSPGLKTMDLINLKTTVQWKVV